MRTLSKEPPLVFSNQSRRFSKSIGPSNGEPLYVSCRLFRFGLDDWAVIAMLLVGSLEKPMRFAYRCEL